MAVQYSLNLSDAASAAPAELQNIAAMLNPAIGALTPEQLSQLQNQLMDITPSHISDVELTGLAIGAAPSPGQPPFNLAYVSAPDQLVQAGLGNDTITGADGDTLMGSTNPYGGANLTAGIGNETLQGGAGQDTMQGGATRGSHTLILGGSGSEAVVGGVGNTTVAMGSGQDTYSGGSGNSTVVAGVGHESVYGGAGTTTFEMSAADFNNDLFQGGGGTSTNIFVLTDLNRGDVTIKTQGATTTVQFGGETVTLQSVNEILFKDGSHQTLGPN